MALTYAKQVSRIAQLFKSEDYSKLKKTLLFVFSEVYKNRRLLFLLYFSQIMIGTLAIAQNFHLQKKIFDKIILLLSFDCSDLEIKKTVFLMLTTLLLGYVLAIIQNFLNNKTDVIGEEFNINWSIKLNRKVMTLPYKFTENADNLNKVQNAKDGKNWYSGGVTGILDDFFSILQAIGNIGVVVCLITTRCPLLIPVQVLSLLIVSLLNQKNNKLSIETYRKQSKNNRIFNYFFFTLGDYKNGKDIRIFDCKNIFKDKMKDIASNQIHLWKGLAHSTIKNSLLIEFINLTREFISFLFIGIAVFEKRISISDFILCINAFSEFYTKMNSLIGGFQKMLMHSIYASDFISFLQENINEASGNLIPHHNIKHTIEIRNVAFKYSNKNEYALKNINISFKSGETICLVGSNGTGKTTFVKLLCRLYTVTSGKILLNGIDIASYDVDEYRKLISPIFQDYILFPFSIKDNICLNSKFEKGSFNKALLQSNLIGTVENLPLKEDTPIMKGFEDFGVELSGGEKQKIAMARCFFKNSPILIMDEPNASFDCMSERDIFARMELNNKITIIVSHRLEACKYCNRIIVFDKGRIVADGNHSELLRKNSLYQKMWASKTRMTDYIDS